VSETGLSPRHNTHKAGRSGIKDIPMLVIFNNKNSIQIAWDSKVPTQKAETRAQELDVRAGTVGVIRTNNAG
jgi:hypothetical protein